MSNVIGFKMLFGKDFYEVNKSKRDSLIGSKASLNVTIKLDEQTYIPEHDNNFERAMIHNNELTVTEFDEETGIGTCMFKHPIPIELYREVYPNDEIITDD